MSSLCPTTAPTAVIVIPRAIATGANNCPTKGTEVIKVATAAPTAAPS